MKGIEMLDLRDETYEGDDENKGPRNLQFGKYQDEETGLTMGVLIFALDDEDTIRPSNSGKTDVIATAGSSCWLGNLGFKVNILHTVPDGIREKRVLKARLTKMKNQLKKLEEAEEDN